MTCYFPIEGYQNTEIGGPVVFNKARGYADKPITIPCGQCIGCRLERSRQWAIRCVHEASLYEQNSFVTLTYDDAHLPPNRSLDIRDYQLFMKRLRKRSDRTIRFFHCGEYGDENGRPHYHAILFNLDFPDKEIYSNRDGNRLYTSKTLQDIWGKGFCTFGAATFESAAYVARYCVKKRTGKSGAEYYRRKGIAPEYATMSRRPGIGRPWLAKFHKEVFDWDRVVIRGQPMRPPKSYDRFLEAIDPKLSRDIKGARRRAAAQHAENQTTERLAVREEVQYFKSTQLKRTV